MKWLSQSAETLIKLCTDGVKARSDASVDVAVVGSGYGGAVAALRFAEHGQTVYVLERGDEYVSGDFPNDLSQIGKHVRSEVATASGVAAQGYENALFDFRIGLRAGALIGNGLGGGSLINAGVGLRPDDKVFEQEDWPAALRQEKEFDVWFGKARKEHELQLPIEPVDGCNKPFNIFRTKKFERMQELADLAKARSNKKPNSEGTKVEFHAAPIAVQLNGSGRQDLGPREPCIGCGDCVTGCNNKAKLTLTSTYLPQAFKAGAELFTGLTVLYVSYDKEGDGEHPWLIHFIRTAERALQHQLEKRYKDLANNAKNPLTNDRVYTLRARRVVLGAGAFGSTEIMLRSRDKGLSLSNTALGIGVSGNGDDVSMAYDLKQEASSIGQGSRDEPQAAVGPTISSYIKFTDPDDVKKGTLIQDGAVPGLMRGVVHELFTSLGMLAQMGNFRFRQHEGRDWLALDPKVLERCLTLLGMGHDSAGGVMVFDRKTDRMGWGWPNADEEKAPALHKGRQKKPIEKMGGLYIQNPAVNALPGSMSKVLSGPKAGGGLFTVHPLGGCRMSDMALTGVVNHWGQAWTADGDLHDGLYVMDGSTIPSSLGANPMLTITALAERACSMILKGISKGDVKKYGLPQYPDCITPLKVSQDVHPNAQLSEVLRGTMTVRASVDNPKAPNALIALTKKKNSSYTVISAALFMEFEIDHWQTFFDNRDHEVIIKKSLNQTYTSARLVLEVPLKDSPQGYKEPPVILTVTGGKVNFFCKREDDWWTSITQWRRTAETYWAYRWGPDLSRLWKNEKTPVSLWNEPKKFIKAKFQVAKKVWNNIVGAMKLIGHASEVREFRYSLKLVDTNNNPYTLTGTKTIEAAASSDALQQWQTARKQKNSWPAPYRRSLWQQISEVEMTLSAGSGEPKTKPLTVICKGRLSMDIPDMLRRVVPSIGLQRDSLNALLKLSGYPLFLMRAMLKMRLLDFKLPDYREDAEGKPDLPDTDPAAIDKPEGYFELDHVKYPDLPANPTDNPGKNIEADKPILLEVPLTWPKSPEDDIEMIRLGLVRYRQKKLQSVAEGAIRRVKSIVLLNGFDLSTKPFVAEELNFRNGGNLATQLHRAGWDVWLFEYRPSPLLDASALFSNMDDIAAFDIPAAVKHIIKTVSGELGTPELEDRTQIFAFTHCVGSASMAMSMLAGYLQHANTGHNQLAAVLFSQYHPFIVGSATAQTRLQFAAFLHNVLRLDTLQFTAGTVKADLIYSMMDRLFSSAYYAQTNEAAPYLHEAHNEVCPGDHDLIEKHPESTTCKRMTGLLSRLFEHDQLDSETHRKLPEYFGRSNMGVYLHGAKCVDYEKLVNADGQNVYVTDKAIRARMDMPIMFLHGEKNVLFDNESWERTLTQFVRVFNPEDSRNVANQLNVEPGDDLAIRSGNIRALRVAKHAHFDCTVGINAPRQIFSKVTEFFEQSFARTPTGEGCMRCRARLPLTGPIVGWVRKSASGNTLVRVWIEVDDMHAGEAIAALTVLQIGEGSIVQAWPVQSQQMLSIASRRNENFNDSKFAVEMPPALVKFAVADIEVPDGTSKIEVQMVSIHRFQGPQPETVPQTGFPPDWGVPLTTVELLGTSELPDLQRDTATVAVRRPMAAAQGGRAPAYGGVEDFTLQVPNGPGKFDGLFNGMDFSALELSVNGVNDQPSQTPKPEPEPWEISGSQIQPLDTGPCMLKKKGHFLTPLADDIEHQGLTAMAAEPGTLSRTRRTRRNLKQRVIELQPTQLQTSNSGKITFFAGACRHPGLTAFEYKRADATLGKVFEKIDISNPQFMLMLGDQIYADVRAGVLDTASPIEKLLPRYRGAFGSSGSFRKLVTRLPLYMVMDDHEINDDWSRDQQNASTTSEVLAYNAMHAFKVFQYAHGPGAPVDPADHGMLVKGFNYSYNCGGLPFLVLDTRSQRTRTPVPQLLHESQWRWLEAWLLAEHEKGAHPKFVISGSVLAPGLKEFAGYPASRNADNWQMSPIERKRLLSFIADNNIDNVVFMSSDYHCSASATITFKDKEGKSKNVKAWAIVVPPIHAPIRFANFEANTVLQNESIPLTCGEVQVKSQAWDGEGWLEVEVARQQPTGGHQISLSFHLRQLEQADWSQPAIVCKWTL